MRAKIPEPVERRAMADRGWLATCGVAGALLAVAFSWHFCQQPT